MTTPLPVIEVLASGPAEGGGIGRFVSYLLRANAEDALLDVKATVDPRGPGAAIASLWRTPAALLHLLALRLRHGAAPVLHVHMAGRLSTARKLPVIALAQVLGYRVVVHYHEYGYAAFLQSLPAPAQALVTFVLRRCAGHIVLGAKEAHALPELLKAPVDRFSIVHTCAPRALLTQTRADPETPVGLVFVGALSDRKGVTPLLQACADLAKRDLPPWRLTLCGGGDVTSRQAEAAALGLGDRCSFTGHVNEQRVREELARNRIFVLPSFAEGLSVALLEAMALGCAVVATPVGEQESVLENETNALVTEPGDVAAIADALARLIADHALAQRLATAARNSIATAFTNDHALKLVTQALRRASR